MLLEFFGYQPLSLAARVAVTGRSKTALDTARKEMGDAIVIESNAGDAAEQAKLPTKSERHSDS